MKLICWAAVSHVEHLKKGFGALLWESACQLHETVLSGIIVIIIVSSWSAEIFKKQDTTQELSGTSPELVLRESQNAAGTNGRRTAVQIGGALQYKLEVYCGVSLSPMLISQQGTALRMGGRTAVQIGGVLPVPFRRVVRGGGS